MESNPELWNPLLFSKVALLLSKEKTRCWLLAYFDWLPEPSIQDKRQSNFLVLAPFLWPTLWRGLMYKDRRSFSVFIELTFHWLKTKNIWFDWTVDSLKLDKGGVEPRWRPYWILSVDSFIQTGLNISFKLCVCRKKHIVVSQSVWTYVLVCRWMHLL